MVAKVGIRTFQAVVGCKRPNYRSKSEDPPELWNNLRFQINHRPSRSNYSMLYRNRCYLYKALRAKVAVVCLIIVDKTMWLTLSLKPSAEILSGLAQRLPAEED